MKSLFNIFFITFLTLNGLTTLSAQIQMNFTAQFFPQQVDKIYLHTDAPVRYVTTNSEVVTIDINVATNTRKYRVVDHLVANGRYDMQAKATGEIMNLYVPNLEKSIRINNKPLKEMITYTIYIPKGMKVGKYKNNNLMADGLFAAK